MADTQDRGELSGVCTDDIVEHVPGADAQCLAAIHGLPRLRGPECRDVQQPLVHDGQRIAHRLVVAFVDPDRKFPLGKDLISDLDLRVKNRATVNDLGTLHAVHPDRQVVYGLGVRLQQGGVHIEIGRHIPGYPQPVGRLLLVRKPCPAARQHTRPVFHREKHPPSRRSGQIDRRQVADFVVSLVQGEREHGCGRWIALARVPAPVGPVDVDFPARGVAAPDIADKNEVFAPRGIVDPKGNLGFARRGFQSSRSHRPGGLALDIAA